MYIHCTLSQTSTIADFHDFFYNFYLVTVIFAFLYSYCRNNFEITFMKYMNVFRAYTAHCL